MGQRHRRPAVQFDHVQLILHVLRQNGTDGAEAGNGDQQADRLGGSQAQQLGCARGLRKVKRQRLHPDVEAGSEITSQFF